MRNDALQSDKYITETIYYILSDMRDEILFFSIVKYI